MSDPVLQVARCCQVATFWCVAEHVISATAQLTSQEFAWASAQFCGTKQGIPSHSADTDCQTSGEQSLCGTVRWTTAKLVQAGFDLVAPDGFSLSA